MFTEFPVGKILKELEQDNLLPGILFRTSRRQCDLDVERLLLSKAGRVNTAYASRLRADVDAIIEKYGIDRRLVENHGHYEALLETGVGAHHAGQLLVWRLLLEELMSRGVLRLMIATGTVAAGVDFPARTVIITAHSKRGSEGFRVLSSSEFQQMSGRAGRRGKDAVGICLIAPSPFSDARVIFDIAKRPPEPLRSAYFAAPATVLNLLKHRSVDELRYTVLKSLAAFLDRKSAKRLLEDANQLNESIHANSDFTEYQRKKALKRVRREIRDAERLEQRQLVQLESTLWSLRQLGHLNDGGLTEKGVWAAELCTSLVLELAEAIDGHLITRLSLRELVGVVASIAGDSYRTYVSLRKNPLNKEYLEEMQEAVERVAAVYQANYEVTVVPDASATVLMWLDAESWQSFSGFLRLAGSAEGDVARLISQTADHLHQISRLHESHPELARLALEARRQLLRPPITDSFEVSVAPEESVIELE